MLVIDTLLIFSQALTLQITYIITLQRGCQRPWSYFEMPTAPNKHGSVIALFVDKTTCGIPSLESPTSGYYCSRALLGYISKALPRVKPPRNAFATLLPHDRNNWSKMAAVGHHTTQLSELTPATGLVLEGPWGCSIVYRALQPWCHTARGC